MGVLLFCYQGIIALCKLMRRQSVMPLKSSSNLNLRSASLILLSRNTQPEVKPLNNPPQTLLLHLSLIRISQVTPQRKPMRHPREQLQLIFLLILNHHIDRPIPIRRPKSMIRLRTGQEQRVLQLAEMMLLQERRVGKRSRRADGFSAIALAGCKGLADVWCAETVAHARVLGVFLAELLLDGLDPPGDVLLRDGGVLVLPLVEGLGFVGPLAVLAVQVHGVAVEVVQADDEVAGVGEGVHHQEAVGEHAEHVGVVEQDVAIGFGGWWV